MRTRMIGRRYRRAVLFTAAATAAGLTCLPGATGSRPGSSPSASRMAGARPAGAPSAGAASADGGQRGDPTQLPRLPPLPGTQRAVLDGAATTPGYSGAPADADPRGADDAEPPATEAAAPHPDDGPAWSPSTALPLAADAGQRVDVVFAPHPDDETLSLGVWIADAVTRGDRVILVSLTDGRTTGAITGVARRLGRALTRDQIAAARIHELDAAARQLGIRPGDIYLARLDRENGPGGTGVTEPEALAVIKVFAARFPAATFATMSWIAERHPDHLSAGLALREAIEEGSVQHAVFAVSRLWWSLPSPPSSDVLPANALARRRVMLAAEAYGRWDPAGQRLAVGWASVHQQFMSLLADPRDRVHG